VKRTKKIIYTLQIALAIHINCKKRGQNKDFGTNVDIYDTIKASEASRTF
jgi:hypothetical protein